jgi:hypothetical protein
MITPEQVAKITLEVMLLCPNAVKRVSFFEHTHISWRIDNIFVLWVEEYDCTILDKTHGDLEFYNELTPDEAIDKLTELMV